MREKMREEEMREEMREDMWEDMRVVELREESVAGRELVWQDWIKCYAGFTHGHAMRADE